jgi:hypothetical protein
MDALTIKHYRCTTAAQNLSRREFAQLVEHVLFDKYSGHLGMERSGKLGRDVESGGGRFCAAKSDQNAPDRRN